MKKINVLTIALAIFGLVLGGCGNDKPAEKAGATNQEIVVGVTAGPHAEVVEAVKAEAAKEGLTVKIVEFNDYVQLNIALDQKELDLNSFQHQPYLDKFVQDRQVKVVSIGKTILAPMALYSEKFKSLQDTPQNATVAIPNDPTNGGRALLLLQQANLLKLKEGVGSTATLPDIVENPKNLVIKELDAAQIPRSLNDVDLAAVNTNYAINAGLNPLKDSLLVERKDSPYANVIAVRQGDENNEAYKKFVKVYQSEPIRKFIDEHFQGSIIPAF